jgi:hypothetical protein
MQVGLKVNTEKTVCRLIFHSQNAGKYHNTKTANTTSENVAKFKYFGKTVRDQNFIHKEIKSRLNSGNACYHSVQKVLSSRLLYKNVNGTFFPGLN